MFSYVAIPKAGRRNKINTTHRVPSLTLQYIVTTDAATSSLHKFPMANVGSGRRAESSHKKRRMNAFTKLIKPPILCSTVVLQYHIIRNNHTISYKNLRMNVFTEHILQPPYSATSSRRDGHSFKTKWRRIQFFGKLSPHKNAFTRRANCLPKTAW